MVAACETESATCLGLKEWDAACHALIEGDQVVLLRKGGLREDGGGFRVPDRPFLLLPTTEHQDSKLVRDEQLWRLTRTSPGADSVRVFGWGEVVEAFQIEEDSRALAAAQWTIWNEDFVRLRLNWNAYDPLTALLIRAYRLDDPVVVERTPAMSGCRSWIDLPTVVNLSRNHPALSNARFSQVADQVRSLLV